MSSRALEGIRVLEFGPYVALPLTGRILASLGAEVIKVDSLVKTRFEEVPAI